MRVKITFIPLLLFLAAGVDALLAQPATNPPSLSLPMPRRMNRVEPTNAGAPRPAAPSIVNTVSTPTNTGALRRPTMPTEWNARMQTNLAARFTNMAPRPAVPPPMTGPGTLPARPGPGGVAAAPPPLGGGAAAPDPGAAPPPEIAPPANALTAMSTNAEDETVFPPGLIKFQDADLAQVLEVYQELTGRTVMRSTLPAAKVTIRSQTPLTRREAIQALDSILSLNGVSMVPQGDKFVKAVPSTQVPTEAREFNELPHADLPNSGTPVSQIVRITNQMPREVAQALQPFAKLPNSILAIDAAGILILRDYSENVKRMMEVLQQIDVVPQQEFVDVVIPIKYAMAGDIAQVLGSLTAGGGSTTVGRQQTRTGLTSGSGGFGSGGTGSGGYGSGGLGGMSGGMNQAGYNPNATGGFGGGAGGGLGSSAAGRSSFANRLAGIVNRAAGAGGDIVILGTTKIIADERTNSLLIFASKQDLTTISNIIEKLDVVLPQVLIEAIILEVSLGEDLNYGVSYLQRQPSTAGDFSGIGAIKNVPFLNFNNFLGGGTNGASGLAGGLTYIARLGDFDATLTAAANDSRINVLSRPRIQTSHAVEANLFVGRTRPYVTGTYYSYGGGPSTQFQQQQIGITLSVLPLINPDGLVVMDIRQRIQSIGKEIPIDANFNVPETIDREANAKVSVRDRETVILGGFISNERTRTKSGVPILKDIPVLGNLFSSNSRRDDRSELMVLIRPTVLPNPADAAVAAVEEKAKMPGISAAEADFMNAERKRQQKGAKDIYKREGY